MNLTAQVYDKVVGQSDIYTSVNRALSRVSNNSSEPILVFVKNGTYEEKVELESEKSNICLIGQDVDSVIITYSDYAGKDDLSSADTYTFLVSGDNFYAENITFVNSYGSGSQALAIRLDGDKAVFKNCKFIGFQDTYYAHKNRQYNYNCYVEGATDFIYGDATSVFDSCKINCVSGGSYISAPADTKLTSETSDGETFLHGLLFIDCVITADDDVSADSYYLGRPWQANSSSVYINCTLGEHIKDAGWAADSDGNYLSTVFAEYKSKDTDGNLVDTTQRVDWSYQLTDDDTAYYNLDYFFEDDDVVWNPKEKIYILEAPTDLTVDNYQLTWTAVDSAVGYVIIRNDSVVGFSETTSYTDESADSGTDYSYIVKSVTTYGSNSSASEAVTVEGNSLIHDAKTSPFSIELTNDILMISENVDIELFTIDGKLVMEKTDCNHLSVNSFKNGIYLVKAVNKIGITMVKKIAL